MVVTGRIGKMGSLDPIKMARKVSFLDKEVFLAKSNMQQLFPNYRGAKSCLDRASHLHKNLTHAKPFSVNKKVLLKVCSVAKISGSLNKVFSVPQNIFATEPLVYTREPVRYRELGYQGSWQ